MSDFGVEVAGLADAIQTLDEAIADLQQFEGGNYLVGTGVEYAVYLEFGTRDMDPKPFVRPALRNVADDVERIARDTDDPGRLVDRVAFALEREIKQVITRKGLIDTGTLRASVRAVPNGAPGGLPGADEVDVAASAGVEVDA